MGEDILFFGIFFKIIFVLQLRPDEIGLISGLIFFIDSPPPSFLKQLPDQERVVTLFDFYSEILLFGQGWKFIGVI